MGAAAVPNRIHESRTEIGIPAQTVAEIVRGVVFAPYVVIAALIDVLDFSYSVELKAVCPERMNRSVVQCVGTLSQSGCEYRLPRRNSGHHCILLVALQGPSGSRALGIILRML